MKKLHLLYLMPVFVLMLAPIVNANCVDPNVLNNCCYLTDCITCDAANNNCILVPDYNLGFYPRCVYRYGCPCSPVPQCDSVTVGGCELEICPYAFDLTDGQEVGLHHYTTSIDGVGWDSRETKMDDTIGNGYCDNDNLIFTNRWNKDIVAQDEITISTTVSYKNAGNSLKAGYGVTVMNPDECRIASCRHVVDPYSCGNMAESAFLEPYCRTDFYDSTQAITAVPVSRQAKLNLDWCGDGIISCGEVCDTALDPLCASDCSGVRECISDADCVTSGITCEAYGYANRYAGCDPSMYTCSVCDPCTSNSHCESTYCCESVLAGGPGSADPQCVGIGTHPSYTNYLCNS